MTDDEPLGVRLERAVGDAIQGAVAADEGGFVTRWVALVESVGPEGDRGLWTMTSDDVKAWDTVGLLQHGLHLQLAQTVAARHDDD